MDAEPVPIVCGRLIGLFGVRDVDYSVVMVKHDTILRARTFGFDTGFQAIELSKKDVAMNEKKIETKCFMIKIPMALIEMVVIFASIQ